MNAAFSLRTLFDNTPAGAAVLPPELRRLYDGDLRFAGGSADRPYVIGNFVSTLDGIVSFAVPGKEGGGEISGHDEADRFIMGLLRASADAVMIGSGTLHATHPAHLWLPEGVYAEGKKLYAELRDTAPYTVVVSGSGIVDLNRPMFQSGAVRVLILTTGDGAERLRAAGAPTLPATRVLPVDSSGGALVPAAMLDVLHRNYGIQILLHEGGPTLYAQFIAAGLVNELFVTLSPQLAGSRPEHPRPTMVWGAEFEPGAAPWVQLLSVKQNADHLYLRYVRTPASTSG
jgi:riboflavin biosynthesis pyrimidine reductase